jgi:hypothetical protein
MARIKKSSNFKCYAPSSEPFRFYEFCQEFLVLGYKSSRICLVLRITNVSESQFRPPLLIIYASLVKRSSKMTDCARCEKKARS